MPTSETIRTPGQHRLYKATKPFFAQKIIHDLLAKKVRTGLIIIHDEAGIHGFGSRDARPVSLFVHNPSLYSRILHGGSLALGESYVDGWWDVEDDRLVEFFQVIFANQLNRGLRGSVYQRLKNMLAFWRVDPNTPQVAETDVHAHYDLSNEFFLNMLDRSMTYSCGYAIHENDSLDTMQQQKYALVSRKLGLEKGGRLLDIGCGWGGMLLYAGTHYKNITGTGVTLSQNQFHYAQEKLKEAGLSSRFTIELADYRELTGTYDFIASIGMFEHVGAAQYHTYFQKLRALLSDKGTALLHAIGLEEDPAQPQDPWITKYIFPGSRLPRLEEICHGARTASLAIGHIENLRPHYAITLRHWRKNFVTNWPKIQQISPRYNDTFFRLWNYYLQNCEACFIDSTTELYQTLLCRANSWNFPLRFDFNSYIHSERNTQLAVSASSQG